MKKFFVLIISLFCFSHSFVFADEIIQNKEKDEIQFIYINGSNNNDKKMKKWFFDGMKKLHPNMRDAFHSSAFINEKLLDNGEYVISESPEAFFWGDMSKKNIDSINTDLRITKVFSPKIAQTVRSLIAHFLHDAIWVSHYRNMHPVVDDLHKQVMANYKQNKKVILFGYSAGGFVTYEYLFNKLPSINVQEYFDSTDVSDDFKVYVKKQNIKNTCIDALIDSKLAVFSADGRLVPYNDFKQAKLNLNNLEKYTCSSCVPKDAIKGIVNFASPFVLFYSDVSSPNYPMTYYNKLLYKYILENDIFWLTVNYSDDPLGYPTTKNISYSDLHDKLKMDIFPNEGFLYSKSDVKSRRTFLGAHTSYWATSKKFSKAVVQAYIEGYLLYNSND